ncbi:MAG: benzoyl-CoA reductase subunit C [Ignavibacteria bacterium]|nr:benzoyl-CoA reductase subunit C [Ignavibacteria bacterium]
MQTLTSIIERCKQLAFDLNYSRAKDWKNDQNDRVLIGYMPIYFPREIVYAANGFAVGILGVGDRKQIVKGDAFYQSYICRIPRGIVELALDGHFKNFDGFIFPSICDVIRNLSGMFQILKVGTFVHYLDYPQNFKPDVGGEFYEKELQHVLSEIKKINNVTVTKERLNNSIQLYNKNRKLLEEIYNIRQEYPWRLSSEELYYIVRAGLVIPVEEHNEILEDVCRFIQKEIGEPMDKIKILVSGSFCEQPPIGLIKTIELAGCYIIEDDFLLGSRWIQGDVEDNTDDPISALADAYLQKSTFSSSIYDVENPKEKRLLELVKKRKVDGIIFAAPSFCDPALLDMPILQKACDDNNVRYVSLQYAENTGQFKNIKEQVGAFSDSIKLWGEQLVEVD